ncbi:hypothetical protein RQN30_10740 [Arcanobacterium hippocoleae]
MVKEASLTEYLDILCATANLDWFISADGIITILPQRQTSPKAHLTTEKHARAVKIALMEAEAVIDTSTFITTLEATNHEAQRGQDGKMTDTTQTVRAENQTLAISYGQSVTSIDTCAYSPEALKDLLEQRIKTYEPKQLIRKCAITPWNHRENIHDDQTLSNLLSLEILDPVLTTYRAYTDTNNIGIIHHQITPDSWRIELELIY